jgi:hypothetical protein
MVPVSLFGPKLIFARVVNAPKIDGTTPVNKLPPANISVNDIRAPIVEGMEPLMALLFTKSALRLRKLPISEGSEPVKERREISILMTLLKFAFPNTVPQVTP